MRRNQCGLFVTICTLPRYTDCLLTVVVNEGARRPLINDSGALVRPRVFQVLHAVKKQRCFRTGRGWFIAP